MAKHIFITGGVVSSLGKGLTSAAIGMILERRGLKVSMQKLDPYINVDPGTMSPFQHGEVYVTDDGAETDLDLGHYERFTGVASRQSDNVTSGRIYKTIIERERRGEPRFGRLATASELRQLEDQRGQDGELEGCSVCAEPFSTRDLGTGHDPTDRRRAVALACGHIFCEGCVAEWLRRESTCPLCRAEIADAGAGAGAASAPSMYLV